MSKYIKYIGTLAIGLALGWLIFGTTSDTTEDHNHKLSETANQLWTCSMHPQIILKEAGNCPVCGMDLIPADISIEGLAENEFSMTSRAMALANIETTVIGINSNSLSGLVLTGKIKENEKNNAIQTAHFGGRIEKLLVNTTGEKINKGQTLALIYSPELVTAQKELLTAMQTKDSDPDLYNAVKNKLKLWKLTENQITKIEQSKNVITNFPIYANVNGVVTMKMVEEGNHIKEGQGMFMIANLNTIWADFDAYEKQFSSIKIGDPIVITTHANPREKINAKISFIDPILNTTSRTVTVRAELINSNGILKPGMFVRGVLSPQKAENIHKDLITVPKTAILWTGKRSVVYVKKEGEIPVFEMRNVTLGNEVNGAFEIIEGLEINEEIVSNGTFTVDAAAQLQGKRSMMNPLEKPTSKNELEDDGGKEKETIRVHVSTKFQEQLRDAFYNYLSVKDALVNDDSPLAQKSAANLIEALNKVDMKLLTNNKSHKLWMPLFKELIMESTKIANTKDIELQRGLFIALSNNFSKSLEIYGINKRIYKQYCPMANSNEGAIWLSTEEKILNPYFGASMLECGEIVSIIE